MSASLQPLECPFCTKRGIPRERHMLVEIDTKLTCLKCGADAGAVKDATRIPAPVAGLLRSLAQRAGLQFDYYFPSTNKGGMRGEVVNVRYDGKEAFWGEVIWCEMDRKEVNCGNGKIFGPEFVTAHLPREVQVALGLLRETRFRITEMPLDKRTTSYARTEFVFGLEDAPPAVVHVPYGEQPKVLLVRIELSWHSDNFLSK